MVKVGGKEKHVSMLRKFSQTQTFSEKREECEIGGKCIIGFGEWTPLTKVHLDTDSYYHIKSHRQKWIELQAEKQSYKVTVIQAETGGQFHRRIHGNTHSHAGEYKQTLTRTRKITKQVSVCRRRWMSCLRIADKDTGIQDPGNYCFQKTMVRPTADTLHITSV